MKAGIISHKFKLQKGFSLLEVLVAGAIMSSGLAGLAALLYTSVSGTAHSSYETTASMLADSMMTLSEISPTARKALLNSPPAIVSNCNEYSNCTAQQFLQSSLNAWHRDVADLLPKGFGVVCKDSSPFDGTPEAPGCDGNALLVVKVFWQAGAKFKASDARVVKIIR